MGIFIRRCCRRKFHLVFLMCGMLLFSGSRAILPLNAQEMRFDHVGSWPAQKRDTDLDGSPVAVAVSGNYAYVSDGLAGLQIINVENPAAPFRVGGYKTGEYDAGGGHKEDGSVLKTVLAENYAYLLGNGGLHVIDVSNPAAPVRVGGYFNGVSTDMEIVGKHGYMVGYWGLHVLDLSNPANPSRVGHYNDEHITMGVAIVDNYAYLAGGVVGLSQMLDISNIESPTFVRELSSLIFSDKFKLSGSYLYGIDGPSGELRVFDVRRPTKPMEVGRYSQHFSHADVVLFGRYGFLPRSIPYGWFVLDLSNPRMPVLVETEDTVDNCIDLAADEKCVYAAVGLSGLQIFEHNISENVRIVEHPLSKIVARGETTSLSVTASGINPLHYEWRQNGVLLAGKNASMLDIESASLANAGTYVATVSSGPDSIQSMPATLTVLETEFTMPYQSPKYSNPIVVTPGASNLVIITHGLTTENHSQHDWVDEMAQSISRLVDESWEVLPYRWASDSDRTPVTGKAAAELNGRKLGTEIVRLGTEIRPGGQWAHVHLIGHSAGGALINEAARHVAYHGPETTIHTTFLDAFEGVFGAGAWSYGSTSTWSDNYFAFDNDTYDSVIGRTEGAFEHSFNADITLLDPQYFSFPVISSPESSTVALLPTSRHSWPWEFYLQTIPPYPGIAGYSEYGFARSMEGGGWDNRSMYPHDGTLRILGDEENMQIAFPLRQDQLISFASAPQLKSKEGSLQIAENGFTMETGDVFERQSSSLSTDGASPQRCWLSTGLTVTNRVNGISMQIAFHSDPPASSHLSIYFNNHFIGQIDEKYALPELGTYSFAVPQVFYDRPNSLSFRLDARDEKTSSISVTNVVTTLVGGDHPVTSVSLRSDETLRLEVLAPAHYPYVLQASTNLVEWTTVGTILITNAPAEIGTKGTVAYEEKLNPQQVTRFLRVR